MTRGYKNVSLIRQLHLEVSDGHSLYIEERGNPEGQPVLFLHGGPGGSISDKSFHFFNPDKYHIIAFDQRGTGQSRPFLSLENNTVDASVEDIEAIRQHLNINNWIIFGGSYGSTLALAYAIKYPKSVQHMVLRGIFLGRQEDIDWLFEGGAGNFYPEEFAKFKNFVPENRQNHIVKGYYEIMMNGDISMRNEASKAWADWESGLTTIIPNFNEDPKITNSDLSLGLLEAHYFANNMFWDDDNYLLNNMSEIADIPIDIVHGRLDVDCRVKGAYDLKEAHLLNQLHVVEGGAHSPFEPVMMEKLVSIMDRLARN